MDTRATRLQRQAALRSKYEAAAQGILEAISSEPKKFFSPADLANLGVHLLPFDPLSEEFIQSRKCLFQPLSTDFLAEFFIEDSELMDSDRKALQLLEPASPPDDLSSLLHAAREIFLLLETTYSHLKRKKPKAYLFELVDWEFIACDDDFHEANGFYPYKNHLGIPLWSYLDMMQHCTTKRGKTIIRPHLQLVMGNDAVVKESGLLMGELGPIVQGILARINQPCFKNTSLIPVQIFSFFGPLDGRILQARFYPSGQLVIRASGIYHFTSENQEYLASLFLRYRFSEPRVGDGYEFDVFDVAEESPAGFPDSGEKNPLGSLVLRPASTSSTGKENVAL
ncbi:hypothetical protein ASPZODRAFT_132574 [Penicilliopsis zonata CBS 506.65]|uniref:Uncharacterized protein n=1 Tax=Penicilliopsis zonata CBS 506.65 TaxID=1073090 RepID=A0A1L9SHD4_9EURO|nr:hypothetical protein ASPZODRAFT_132574 [Penicilliopsis zonata CBS 506.65]OJJ46496.1 hypothetical protein ASPZODRAFT_132574 [Penicilliopsis zonata CBS 506.65]